MAIFTFTGGTKGVNYTGSYYLYDPYIKDLEQAINNIESGNATIISESLSINGRLSIYSSPGFRFDYKYYDFKLNNYSVSYGNASVQTSRYGTKISSSTVYGYAYINNGSSLVRGYVSKVKGVDFRTGVNSEMTGNFNYSKIGVSAYSDYLYYVSGNDTFSGTNHGDRIDSGKGLDIIYGNNGNDTLYGGSDHDWIDGGSGDDRLYGGSGIDQLTGSSGNDYISGGSGSADTAIYTGSLIDYEVTKIYSGTYQIKDLRSGTPDGLDDLYSIEIIRFTDQSLTPDQAIQSLKDIKPKNLVFNSSKTASNIVGEWFPSSSTSAQSKDVLDGSLLKIQTTTWGENISINRVVKSSASASYLQAKQSPAATDSSADPWVGSVIEGGSGADTIRGLAGMDILDGNAGDDLIHGGNGRDIIDGGAGADELHGDFGWNTFRSEKDGASDLIAIKSDQYLANWMIGNTAGNSPNGEKVDIIEGLDAIDEIKIIGVLTSDLTFAPSNAKGVVGIGIYAKGTLEALYTGGDLATEQIQAMTTGDTTAQWSYRTNATTPDLLA